MKKCRMNMFLVMISMAFFFAAPSVFGDITVYWVGGSTTGDPNLWNVADNWNPAMVPTLAELVVPKIFAPPTKGPVIDSTVTGECHRIYGPQGGTGSAPCLMQITGGSLTLNDWRVNDNATSGPGEVQMSGGTVNVIRDHLHLGYRGQAVWTMSDGTINLVKNMYIAEEGTSKGTLNLSGGTINVGDYIGLGMRSEGNLYMSGGTLNVTNFISQSDLAVASTKSEAVMYGGDITTRFLRIGRRGPGVWIMNGGTITLSEYLVIGEDDLLGDGYLEFNGGTITLGRPGGTDLIINTNNGSRMNMTGSALMVIRGDATAYLDPLITDGRLVAYDGAGTIHVQYLSDINVTEVRAIHMFDPDPFDGGNLGPGSQVLQWTLPDPNIAGEVVTCDVLFGTDPNVTANPKIVDGQALESAGVTLAANQEYYWQIKTYSNGVSYIEGPVFTFDTYNLPPLVDAGDGDTWLPESGPRLYTTSPIVGDDGRIDPLTYQWTILDDANDLNPAGFIDPTIKNAVIELKEVGDYELQLEAYDGQYTVSDTVVITVYPDACTHAAAQPEFEWILGDINKDCLVDLKDFVDLASTWLLQNYSEE